MREQLGLMSVPCEDDVHLLSVAGPADFSRGSAAERERRYLEGLRQFPGVLNPRLLDNAERLIFQIAEQTGRNKQGFISVKDVLPTVVDRIDQLYQQDGTITGLSIEPA